MEWFRGMIPLSHATVTSEGGGKCCSVQMSLVFSTHLPLNWTCVSCIVQISDTVFSVACTLPNWKFCLRHTTTSHLILIRYFICNTRRISRQLQIKIFINSHGRYASADFQVVCVYVNKHKYKLQNITQYFTIFNFINLNHVSNHSSWLASTLIEQACRSIDIFLLDPSITWPTSHRDHNISV